jgi:hypothetical protein
MQNDIMTAAQAFFKANQFFMDARMRRENLDTHLESLRSARDCFAQSVLAVEPDWEVEDTVRVVNNALLAVNTVLKTQNRREEIIPAIPKSKT